MNDPRNHPFHAPFDVIDFATPPSLGMPALVNEDVPIGRLVRALATEGLCFSCISGTIVIHQRRAGC